MRLLFFLVSWLVSSFLWAQTGTYFLSHYVPPGDQIDFRSKALIQDKQGEIYFATRTGILEFDGRNWNMIPVASAVTGLATTGSELFVTSMTSAGRVGSKQEYPRKFIEFNQEASTLGVQTLGDLVFFGSASKLNAFSIAQKSLAWSIQADSSHGNFIGLYSLKGSCYIRTEKRGLLKVDSQKLVASDVTPGNIIFSSASADQSKHLVGMDDHRVFFSDQNEFRELLIKDQTFLTTNVLVNGVFVSDSLIALGTLRGGVLFVNPITGSTEQIIDYSSGLPDNEVFALMTDRGRGVWVAHEYGFTRIAPYIPFRSFAHFPGLSGNLLCAQTYMENVFVGTTLGLFQLVDDSIPTEPPVVKRKSKNKPSTDTREIPVPETKKTQSFVYKKVEGIVGRVTQLTEVNGKLIASGIGGVYEVTNLNAKAIVQEPVRTVFYSSLLKQLFVGTYAERVRTFRVTSSEWEETNHMDSLHDFISHVFRDRLENIWLCGRSSIYKVETLDSAIVEVVAIPITNPSRDETVGLAYGSDLYVAASGQFSRYDGKGFVKFDSLPGPRKYFATGGYFWFHDGTRWRTVDRRLQGYRLDWLRLFSNLRYLAPDSRNKSLWVISSDNELYKFGNTTTEPALASYPLFLTGIQGTEITANNNKIEVEQHKGGITFEFIQPDFVGNNTTQYRYQVKGLNAQWSPWSASNNVVSFSYLPSGKYQLAIQSRDILGNESKIEQISFHVLSPYWQRWWFYALEFAVFSFLVILSLRLGRASTRYRYVSQVLSLLTVVMLIQFLQTLLASLIGSKTSPVIDFIIQVLIALVVFPIEIFARNAMIKYSQGKYEIKRAWDKK